MDIEILDAVVRNVGTSSLDKQTKASLQRAFLAANDAIETVMDAVTRLSEKVDCVFFGKAKGRSEGSPERKRTLSSLLELCGESRRNTDKDRSNHMLGYEEVNDVLAGVMTGSCRKTRKLLDAYLTKEELAHIAQSEKYSRDQPYSCRRDFSARDWNPSTRLELKGLERKSRSVSPPAPPGLNYAQCKPASKAKIPQTQSVPVAYISLPKRGRKVTSQIDVEIRKSTPKREAHESRIKRNIDCYDEPRKSSNRQGYSTVYSQTYSHTLKSPTEHLEAFKSRVIPPLVPHTSEYILDPREPSPPSRSPQARPFEKQHQAQPLSQPHPPTPQPPQQQEPSATLSRESLSKHEKLMDQASGGRPQSGQAKDPEFVLGFVDSLSSFQFLKAHDNEGGNDKAPSPGPQTASTSDNVLEVQNLPDSASGTPNGAPQPGEVIDFALWASLEETLKQSDTYLKQQGIPVHGDIAPRAGGSPESTPKANRSKPYTVESPVHKDINDIGITIHHNHHHEECEFTPL